MRVSTLIVAWLGFVYLAAPRLGLYYETLAAWYMIPSLVLVYVYCLSHQRRSTALLAVVASIVAVIVVGLAAVIPKASSVA
jgi:branched-subunit amino acid transport protein AzlD